MAKIRPYFKTGLKKYEKKKGAPSQSVASFDVRPHEHPGAKRAITQEVNAGEGGATGKGPNG
jgi:hypothetical protein